MMGVVDDDLLDGIRAWLDKSGRVLELRAARTLGQAGAVVQSSFTYTDPNSGTRREGDVLARFAWTGQEDIPCSLTAVVEVKSGTKHPWVAFYDRSLTRRGDLDSWVYFAHGPFVGITEPLLDRWYGEEPFDVRQVATHTVAAHVADTGKNHANDAVRQVLSACEAVKQRYIQRQGTDRVGLVVLPVIVTNAPLVRCSLDAKDEVHIEQIDSFQVWGSGPASEPRRVYVVSEECLPHFAASLRRLARAANYRMTDRHP